MDNQKSIRKYGKTLGASGTAIFSGLITNEEYNTRLQGNNALRIYDIMRRSEESVRAALQMVKLPLLQLERRIEPASDDEFDQYVARFVESQLLKNQYINFNKMAKEALTFFDFGHSLAEKTYDATEFEGQLRLGLVELGFRKQTSIHAWETLDRKPGITQLLPTGGTISIPRDKLVVWTHDQEGDNYEGISLLRYAYKSWDMADKLGIVHAMGLEKMAIPTPVLGVPSGASAEDEENAIASLQQYRANEKAYIKKPVGWELDKFDMSGQTLAEMLPALQHYETKILLSVLGQFLMLGTNSGSGSRAVSEDHSKLFMLSEEAANDIFQDALQEQVIKQLCDFNFTNLPNGYPRLVSSAVKDDDVAMLAEAVSKLKGAQLITPTYETENHLRKVVHLPELPEDYEADYEKQRELRLNPPEPTVIQNTPPAKPPKTKAHAISAAKDARNNLIDILVRG